MMCRDLLTAAASQVALESRSIALKAQSTQSRAAIFREPADTCCCLRLPKVHDEFEGKLIK
jgi:hypothetical protein